MGHRTSTWHVHIDLFYCACAFCQLPRIPQDVSARLVVVQGYDIYNLQQHPGVQPFVAMHVSVLSFSALSATSIPHLFLLFIDKPALQDSVFAWAAKLNADHMLQIKVESFPGEAKKKPAAQGKKKSPAASSKKQDAEAGSKKQGGEDGGNKQPSKPQAA